MARVSKTAEVRQDEILDVAQRLFLQRGYDHTSIQAIIDEIGIAKGTFYHHYPSKPALLDALVARMVRQILEMVEPMVQDPAMGAIDKFNRVNLRIGAWKNDRRDLLIEMHRAMHAESNAPLLARIQRDSTAAIIPILARIIGQGVDEGVFDTRYPHEAARIILEIGLGIGRTIGDALLGDGPPAPTAAALIAALDAYHDAVGRVLGAPPGTIQLVDTEMVLRWFPTSPRLP